ncbi:MAG TPA: AMP-binding protein [Chloroflexota bacterium]|nr:AMP-binding protein [Chloroflexota bacterium]
MTAPANADLLHAAQFRARTIPDILLQARARHGARPALALRDPARGFSWTFDETVAFAAGVARWLRVQGVERGDRVVLWGPNEPAWGGTFFGALLVGAVVVPLDARGAPDFAARVTERTRPRLQVLGAAQPPVAGVPAVRFADLPPLERGLEPPAPVAAPDDLAEIVFTSGTTGAPKGVMITHGNLVSNVRSMIEVVPIQPTYRLLSLLPLSHMFEQAVGLGAALSGGASVVYVGTLRPDTIFEALGAEGITTILAVPQVLQLFLSAIEREARRGGRERLFRLLQAVAPAVPFDLRRHLFAPVHERLGGRFLFFVSGGAYLDPALARAWENMGVKVVQGYGATEASPAIAANSLARRNLRSIGKPLSCNAVRLAADGEIQARGANITPGYWEDPVATAAVFEDDWYCTGDLARQDADGYLYLIGRKKNVIVLASGENVYPEDVESLLVQQPGVRDAVVLGLTRPDGEVEVHAVLLASDADAAAAAVKAVNRHLAIHQRVRSTTLWPDEDFPRTLTLKPRRPEIETRLRTLRPEYR